MAWLSSLFSSSAAGTAAETVASEGATASAAEGAAAGAGASGTMSGLVEGSAANAAGNAAGGGSSGGFFGLMGKPVQMKIQKLMGLDDQQWGQFMRQANQLNELGQQRQQDFNQEIRQSPRFYNFGFDER